MKKKWILILSIGALVVLGAVLLLTHDFGTCPFADLKAEDLASAQVQYYNWTKEVEDKEELAALLREIKIYRKDRIEKWKDLTGAPSIVRLRYQDGRESELRSCGGFFVIDEVGYFCDSIPNGALSEYIREFLDLK